MIEAHMEHKANNKRGNTHNFSILPQNYNSVVCLNKDMSSHSVFTLLVLNNKSPLELISNPCICI